MARGTLRSGVWAERGRGRPVVLRLRIPERAELSKNEGKKAGPAPFGEIS